MLLDASGWQLEQAPHGLPPEALHPLGVHQLPHPVLEEVDDVRLEQRAVAAEEGGEGFHPLAGPRRRLARVRAAAAARRSRRHRAGRREVGCVGRGTEPELESEVRSSQ